MPFPFPANPSDGQQVLGSSPDGPILATYRAATNSWSLAYANADGTALARGGLALADLHDTGLLAGAVDGQVPVFSTANGGWIPSSVSTGGGSSGGGTGTGTPGAQGPPGPAGTAATVQVGTTTTGAPGSQAAVVNTGSPSAAVLAFTIPRGDAGPAGPTGAKGDKGDPGTGVSIHGSLADASALPATGQPGDAYLIGGNLHVWTGTQWENVGSIQGPAGPAGPAGADSTVPGPAGPAGPKGDKGDPGDVSSIPVVTDQANGLMSPALLGNLNAALDRTNSLQEDINNLFAATPEPWTAKAYAADAVVSKDGKFWLALRTTADSEVPGADPKWAELTLEHIAGQVKTALGHRVPDWSAATDHQVLTVVTAGSDPVWANPPAAPDLTNYVQSTDIHHMVKLTQAAYDALATKDDATFYVIVG